MKPTEMELIAALLAAVHHMHPTYANTSGWRGGIGGQTITRDCSFNDPPPGVEWAEGEIDEILRYALLSLSEEDLISVRALATALTTRRVET